MKYAIDIRASRSHGRKYGIWQKVWLKPIINGETAGRKYYKDWILVGEVDLRCTGPKSKAGKIAVKAKKMLEELNS
jgi:hypothetical protein